MKNQSTNKTPQATCSGDTVGGSVVRGKAWGFLFLREGVMSEALQNDIGFLATKVRIIGEFLTVMEKDELTGPDHNEYQNIGEVLYCAGEEISELLEKNKPKQPCR
jgi:hypothetical protein